MKTIIKNYQDDLISDVLSASSFAELKNSIDTVVSKFKTHGFPEIQLKAFLDEILNELKRLNQGRLPYELHANIISAKNILKNFRMQDTNPNVSI